MNPAGQENMLDAVQTQGITPGSTLGQVGAKTRELQSVSAIAEKTHQLASTATCQKGLTKPEQ